MVKDRWRYSLIIAAIGAVFFIPFLGGVHLFDWDEINFAEISREMIVLGDYFRVHINYQPFWEKPPLFFWLQVISMKLFGINEFAARFPNAVCGIITLVVLFNIGKTLKSTRFGLIWAGAYFGSVLPFLYFKSGIIDPWFNLFIFLSLWFFIRFYWKKELFAISSPLPKLSYLLLSGFFIGLAILTKGPVGFLIAALVMVVYWCFQRFRMYVGVHHALIYIAVALVVSFAWYGVEVIRQGPWFIEEFVRYQIRLLSTPDAGHSGFPGFHVLVLLVGCFPASIFALRAFFKSPKEQPFEQDFMLWMKILFWVVLVLFTIVQSKIVHYSSMAYFPLTFLAATVIERMFSGEVKMKGWMKWMVGVIGGIFVFAVLAVPILAQNIEWLKSIIADPFAKANLEAEVNWTGWEVLPGLWLLCVLVIFFVWLKKGKLKLAFPLLSGGVAVFVLLTLVFFIARIESYSQRAAIQFFSEHADEDAYLVPVGYKTYGHLFYGEVKPNLPGERFSMEWLFYGPIDRDVFFVTRNTQEHHLQGKAGIERIGEKNGFVFYYREAAN